MIMEQGETEVSDTEVNHITPKTSEFPRFHVSIHRKWGKKINLAQTRMQKLRND